MSKFYKVVALALSLALMMSFTACSKQGQTQSAGKISADAQYPIDTDKTLTYWVDCSKNITASVTGMGETEFAQEAEKRTGIDIEYIHPAQGQSTEQFNLLIASGDLPDIIEYGWYSFPGGPGMAIDDNYIIALNDVMKSHAPNISKYFDEHPEQAKMTQTDDGRYYVFPFMSPDPKLLSTAGPIVRMDLLEKYGMEAPVTYDDWYKMLTAFKNDGIEIPLSFNATNTHEIQQLFGVFGGYTDYYLDAETDTIKYGPFEPEFKETLTMLAKWYSEDLIDKNFTTTSTTIRDSNVLNGKVGATYASGGGQLDGWVLNAVDGVKMRSVKFPVKNVGDPGSKFKAMAYYYRMSGAAITTSCEDPGLAAKYLDYFYGDEGHMLVNFGIEGESYEMVDGKPVYTDKIMKNPDGLSMSDAMARYMRSCNSGPMIQDVGYIENRYYLQEQKDALVNWSWGSDYTQKYKLPLILPSKEEATEVADIANNVNTYRDNMILKFITGLESMDKYDSFIQQMKDYNVERGIEIQQAAYERYKNR